MSRRNTIPEFTSDPRSLETALRTMKDIVEVFLGSRRREGRASQTFVEAIAPDPRAGFNLGAGDYWIRTGDDTLHYWDGRLWKKIQP